MDTKSIKKNARTQRGKCKHDFAYDAEKFWCVKCGHTEIRETPASKYPHNQVMQVMEAIQNDPIMKGILII